MTTNDRYYTLVVAQYKKNKLIIIKRKIMQEELSWFDTGSNVRKKEKTQTGLLTSMHMVYYVKSNKEM